MKLIPQQYYLLIRIRDIAADSKIALPEGVLRQPHGEVIAVGPDCKFCHVGDKVMFMLNNLVRFEHTEDAIIAEGAVFAKLEMDNLVGLKP